MTKKIYSILIILIVITISIFMIFYYLDLSDPKKYIKCRESGSCYYTEMCNEDGTICTTKNIDQINKFIEKIGGYTNEEYGDCLVSHQCSKIDCNKNHKNMKFTDPINQGFSPTCKNNICECVFYSRHY